MREVDGWDKYFLKMVGLVSTRSKDPSTQIGSVLVNDDHDIIMTGYNGMVAGMREDDEIWKRPTKYFYVIHSEVNAIVRAAKKGIATEGTTLYTTGIPCNNCARVVAAAGVKKVVCFDDASWKKEPIEFIAADLFKRCDIKVTMYDAGFRLTYDSNIPWYKKPDHIKIPDGKTIEEYWADEVEKYNK